jgi:fructose-bisphosphate aldolase class I
LAADESFPTIEKRFKALGIPSTEQTRRDYRDLLFSTPGLGESISGAILFDESLRQKSSDGTPFPTLLERQGIIPGIKVDGGTTALPSFPGEKITEGLDGLRGRLTEYRSLGARFTKWRAVLAIGADRPTFGCIAANALKLALFAALSQEAGLVPIVEPEVLMDGAHTADRCEEVTQTVLQAVFDALFLQRVRLEDMLLKPAMVLPGTDSPDPPSDDEVATRTLRSLSRHVPAAVPGIVFLSGGQAPEAATRRLAAINRAARGPWRLTFSFGRALQDPALKRWQGKRENVEAAQKALLDCARRNREAVGANPHAS